MPWSDYPYWNPRRLLKQYGHALCCISLITSFLVFVSVSWRWRLSGDAALMHYVGFLLDQGRRPYRDIWDINFPGAYLPDWLFQHIFGPSALAWRLYDLALFLLLSIGMYAMVRFRHWFAALWASTLLAVVHGRDGMEQLGQRDLTASVLLLVAVALMVAVPSRKMTLRWLGFGLCVGLASTIKPVFALFLLLCLDQRSSACSKRRFALYGFLLPPILCAAWLWRCGSLPGFLFTVQVLLPFHAALGHVSVGTLLYKSVSPFLPLVIIWAILLVYQYLAKLVNPDPQMIVLRRTLTFATILGLACFVVQGKAFPYQRYPFLVFLLLLIGSDLTDWLGRATEGLQWSGAIALVWSSLYLAPISVVKASQYDWRSDEFNSQLALQLRRLGVRGNSGSMNGQPSLLCLDTVSGCINVLENMQVLQHSSNLYDEFLFSPTASRAVTVIRTRFLADVIQSPPNLIIVTDRSFPDGSLGYGKLTVWPQFDAWLEHRYCVVDDWKPSSQVRWMGRYVTPPSFRIYEERSLSNGKCILDL